MKNDLQQKLTLFTNNWKAISKEFRWHETSVKRLVAFLYTVHNKPINVMDIRDGYAQIKSQTNAFSAFRGSLSLYVASMLSLKDNRKDVLTHCLRVYKMWKDKKFRPSDCLAIAACEVANRVKPEKDQQTVSRAKAFFHEMKTNGFFRAGQSDYIFAAMFGLSDLDLHNSANKVAQLYRQFRPGFRPRSSVRRLAQVLVLGGASDKAVNRVLPLKKALKERKLKLYKTFTLPSLGILALLPVDIDTLVRDMEDAKAFFKAQKGFGPLAISQQELLLFISGLLASVYTEDLKDGLITSFVSTSISNLVMAQQATMIVAVTSSGMVVFSTSSAGR